MGVRIIEGNRDGSTSQDVAVLYCSTTGVAFGPLFEDYDEAERFLKYLVEKNYCGHTDARKFRSDELVDIVQDFRAVGQDTDDELIAAPF